MHQNEINELTIFSPYNLKEFYDNSIDQLEAGVPKFGVLRNGQTFLLSTDNELDQSEIPKLVKTSNEENGDSNELPVVF